MSGLSRRALLGGAPVFGIGALGGCSVLPQPAYVQRTTWPLSLPPPRQRPARSGGKVLLVRDFQSAPGLDQVGLQWLNANRSVHVDFYNVWEVPPARAAADNARRWLAASGLFAAVIGPDSGVTADLVLEGEVTRFIADPLKLTGFAALAVTVIDQRAVPPKVRLQQVVSGQAAMPSDTPAGIAAALQAALAGLLRDLEGVMARYSGKPR